MACCTGIVGECQSSRTSCDVSALRWPVPARVLTAGGSWGLNEHATTACPGGVWHADPRLEALGRRVVLSSGCSNPVEAQVEEALRSSPDVVEEDVYRSWRYSHGVAEGEDEMPSGGQHMGGL